MKKLIEKNDYINLEELVDLAIVSRESYLKFVKKACSMYGISMDELDDSIVHWMSAAEVLEDFVRIKK